MDREERVADYVEHAVRAKRDLHAHVYPIRNANVPVDAARHVTQPRKKRARAAEQVGRMIGSTLGAAPPHPLRDTLVRVLRQSKCDVFYGTFGALPEGDQFQ